MIWQFGDLLFMFALHKTIKTSFVSANFDKRQTLVCAVAVGSSQSSCASSSTSRQKLLIHRVSEWPLIYSFVKECTKGCFLIVLLCVLSEFKITIKYPKKKFRWTAQSRTRGCLTLYYYLLL